MQKLITGLHQFQSQIFLSHKELFERLSQGQAPDALFITCSDSRINPNLITQTSPGDLFILRNAGNIIPPYGAANGGEGATIEFAVVGLGIKDIIVCGHSLCGAIGGLLNPEKLKDMPAVTAWLSHAEATRRIAKENYSHLSGDALLSAAIQENVLVQIENLRTHPSVASRLSRGQIKLHAWTYKIQTGEVFSYQPDEGQFLPIRGVEEGIERGRPRLANAPSI
ncbi:MAG TPA: carbonic anhydrase [Candidatus Obscuribacterales bacterium]